MLTNDVFPFLPSELLARGHIVPGTIGTELCPLLKTAIRRSRGRLSVTDQIEG